LSRRPEQCDAPETLQFFGSAMVELHYNRRAFTASLASLLLGPISVGHGQQLERSSLKLGVANKAHLYYLPVTIAERRGHFRDYGLAVAMTGTAAPRARWLGGSLASKHPGGTMHSRRTAVLAMLVALLLPAPAVMAETAPRDRSKTAGPISAELAKKCRALAIKAHPTERAGSRPYAQAQRDYFQDCVAKRRQYAGLKARGHRKGLAACAASHAPSLHRPRW
jgi:hypothetical protein